MITYRLENTTVSLDTQSTEDKVPIVFGSETGNADFDVIEAIKNSHDRDGHILGESTTALDLQLVMAKKELKIFKPKLEKGKEILEKGKILPKDVPNYVR